MSKTVLLATEKAFSKGAVDQAEAILTKGGHTIVKLENYKERQALLTAVENVDAMIIRSDKADAEVMEAAKNLKLIVRAGAGFDNIDCRTASEKSIVAMNTPGMNSNAVAELAFGMLVQHCRNSFDGSSGRELRGRKLGLVGCGLVSVQMIKIAKGFGVEVFATDPFLKAEEIEVRGAVPLPNKEDIFKTCDFVSLHIPATPETTGSIGKDLLLSMPTDGVLINTARLEVVDEDSLVEALLARPDLGYISDVQLKDKDGVAAKLGRKFSKQVHFTPKKMGAQTAEANNNCCGAAAKQIVDYFAKGDVSCQVNRSKDGPNPNFVEYSGGKVSTNAASFLGEGRVVNFGAGPCCLPHAVLKTAEQDMLNWQGTAGMSVMEMSHRGKDYVSIIEGAEADMRELLKIPNNFKVLFLQGGATAQFAGVPLNLLGERGATADYVVTGQWSDKAAEEVNKYGKCNRVLDTKKSKFSKIPPQSEWNAFSPDAKYVHYCLNETVNGVEFDYVPEVGDKLLVGDHSSNFMAAPIDWNKHACIYAGAQKNVGPSGNTVVIVREDLLGKALPECPTAMNWKVQTDAGSMYNTPACYPIYMMGLYLKYMKKIGGIPALQSLTEERSKLLYETIESSNGFYSAPVDKNARSRVNIPFVIKGDDAALTKKFLSATSAEGLAALAGHRSVGGMRASLYNAMPIEGVARLVKFMKKFQEENA
jgi:phosphoserine aminotransferase